jgi:hypothetical protein
MGLFDAIPGANAAVGAFQNVIGGEDPAGAAGQIANLGNASSVLEGAQKKAEDAIVKEQIKTIDTKIRAKKNEGAYARAGTYLSQNVG